MLGCLSESSRVESWESSPRPAVREQARARQVGGRARLCLEPCRGGAVEHVQRQRQRQRQRQYGVVATATPAGVGCAGSRVDGRVDARRDVGSSSRLSLARTNQWGDGRARSRVCLRRSAMRRRCRCRCRCRRRWRCSLVVYEVRVRVRRGAVSRRRRRRRRRDGDEPPYVLAGVELSGWPRGKGRSGGGPVGGGGLEAAAAAAAAVMVAHFRHVVAARRPRSLDSRSSVSSRPAAGAPPGPGSSRPMAHAVGSGFVGRERTRARPTGPAPGPIHVAAMSLPCHCHAASAHCRARAARQPGPQAPRSPGMHVTRRRLRPRRRRVFATCDPGLSNGSPVGLGPFARNGRHRPPRAPADDEYSHLVLRTKYSYFVRPRTFLPEPCPARHPANGTRRRALQDQAPHLDPTEPRDPWMPRRAWAGWLAGWLPCMLPCHAALPCCVTPVLGLASCGFNRMLARAWRPGDLDYRRLSTSQDTSGRQSPSLYGSSPGGSATA